MTNQKSIRQPSHTKLVLSTATATVEENSEGGAVVLQPNNPTMLGGLALDANDSVRLAAFLNRFYSERDAKAQRDDMAQARETAKARAARRQSVKLVK
jgi:hypothetical protein